MTLACLLVVLLQFGAFVLAVLTRHWTLGRACYALAMLLGTVTRVTWYLTHPPDDWHPFIEALAALSSLCCCFYSYTLWRGHPARTP